MSQWSNKKRETSKHVLENGGEVKITTILVDLLDSEHFEPAEEKAKVLTRKILDVEVAGDINSKDASMLKDIILAGEPEKINKFLRSIGEI